MESLVLAYLQFDRLAGLIAHAWPSLPRGEPQSPGDTDEAVIEAITGHEGALLDQAIDDLDEARVRVWLLTHKPSRLRIARLLGWLHGRWSRWARR